ncbi:MAG: hypothetical protein Q8N23_16765 [Archangium sp.]|nr:hypothetical protein [Archangium sp.]MDP3574163.1 hypothetical protein [Archangium sp.]
MSGLLQTTLAHAVREVPFYRRRLGRRWERVRGVADLPALPFLTKAQAISQQRSLLAGKPGGFVGTISSGTHHSTGELLQVPRSPAEALATRELLAQTFRHVKADGWVLEVRAAHHGFSEGAEPGRLVMPWTYTAQALRLFEQLLSRPQPDGRRVRSVVLGAGALMPLTSWFLSRGIEPRKFGVRAIGTTSFRLSAHWKALVEDAWGCRVRDNFSLSELPAPALECDACGFHHWLPPPMVSEVVDPFTREQVKRGVGVLVVTTLAPYVTTMPLIRYWTGDLVELGPRCAAAKATGFRPLGRFEQAIVSQRDGLMISPLKVSDFLEGRPEVARHAHPLETLGVIPQGDCGAVKFELTRGPKLRVELRFDPMIFSEAARDLGEALGAHLLKARPALRRLERSGRGELEIVLLRPGSLTKSWVKF